MTACANKSLGGNRAEGEAGILLFFDPAGASLTARANCGGETTRSAQARMHTYGPPPKKKVGAGKKREAQQFAAPLAGHAGKASGGETERGKNK